MMESDVFENPGMVGPQMDDPAMDAEEVGLTPEDLSSKDLSSEEIEEVYQEMVHGRVMPEIKNEISVVIINEAYEALYEAAFDVWTAERAKDMQVSKLRLLKTNLESDINRALLEGKIVGKNQGERDAAAQAIFPEAHTAVSELQTQVEDQEFEVNETRLAYNIAKFDVDRIQQLMRFLELQQQFKMSEAMEAASKSMAPSIPVAKK